MRTTRRAWRWAAVALVAGCGGKYEVGLYPDDAGAGTGGPASGAGSTSSASTTGTSTGSTGVTTSVTTTGGSNGSGAGGSSGSGGVVDPCVLTSMKSCQTVGCHGGSTVSANLNLDASTLVTDFRTLVRRNSGDYSYPAACRPGTFYLIDPTNPENSLIYQKLSDIPLCGMRMPQIGAALKPADKACVLSWINSVIAVR